MTIGDNPHRLAARWRVLVLGVAAVAGFAIAIASESTRSGLAADARAADAVRLQRVAETKPEPPTGSETPSKAQSGVDAEISIGEGGVTIRKGGGRRADRDRDDFDSFEQFVEQAPWIAALVFGVTGLLLLFPLLVIVLVVWYKMRSTRMRNETMLKLAERGVVPPGEAIAAVAATSGASALETSPSTAPLYEQAKRVRKRAAWSDLRKGVILGGIGAGITLWSMIEEGSANGFGLVLLFVGIGYVVLWYFEDRQIATPRDSAGGPPGGPSA